MATVTVSKENEFRASIFEAARNQGEATYKCVALLKGIKWADTERVSALRDEFYFGRIAAALQCDRTKAEHIRGLTKFEKGNNAETRRNQDEERAYRAAVSAWSHVALLAGMPDKRSGKKRATRASSANAAPAAVQNAGINPVAAVLSLAKAEDTEDVRSFALLVSEMILAFENRNSAVMDADFRGIFEEYRAKVKALIPAEAPAAPVAPAKGRKGSK